MSKSYLSRIRPVKAWASISEDDPPQIWEVGWYKDKMEMHWLKKIRVIVTPIIPKPQKSR